MSTLETVARQARLVEETAHRPWPLPAAEWVQAQTRHDVLLAFWPVALDELARRLPPELAVDAFHGEAWAGIVAASVAALRVRGLPPLPGLSTFPQLEVVACVTEGGRPGLWVLSLELPKRVLTEAAKRMHRLPAYRAHLEVARGAVEAERDGLSLRATWRPSDRPAPAEPGTLGHFLAERYALYTADGGRLYRADVHHLPARLQPAQVELEAATLVPLALEGEPGAFVVPEQDLLLWPLEEVAGG